DAAAGNACLGPSALARPRRPGPDRRTGAARVLVGEVGGVHRCGRRAVVVAAAVPPAITRNRLRAPGTVGMHRTQPRECCGWPPHLRCGTADNSRPDCAAPLAG